MPGILQCPLGTALHAWQKTRARSSLRLVSAELLKSGASWQGTGVETLLRGQSLAASHLSNRTTAQALERVGSASHRSSVPPAP